MTKTLVVRDKTRKALRPVIRDFKNTTPIIVIRSRSVRIILPTKVVEVGCDETVKQFSREKAA
jgi:hypothetical protein